jgi:glycosyltransferase involved in cell wall biosynthesis
MHCGRDFTAAHRFPLTVNTPKASVIIPAFNRGEYLSRAIDSVLHQTFPSAEIIVIDDGSTDDTPLILEGYGNRIISVRQNNEGVSRARNRGVELATGEYLVFLDADDMLLPNKLDDQAVFLDDRPALGYVHSGWHIINGQDTVVDTIEPWHSMPELDLEGWLLWHPVFMGAAMFRRHWIEKVGGFDPMLMQAEDTDFFLRLALMNCTAQWLKQPTVCYRRHQQGLTQNCPERSRWVYQVVDFFFARPEIPERIRSLEKEIRYNIVIWIVCELYRNGDISEITEYLRRLMPYLDGSPEKIVQEWVGRLVGQCRQREVSDIEKIRSLWPCFKAAVDIEPSRWAKIERFLDWLLKTDARFRKHN